MATLFHTLLYGILLYDTYILTSISVAMVYIITAIFILLWVGEWDLWKKVKSMITNSNHTYTPENTFIQKQWYRRTIRISTLVFLFCVFFPEVLPNVLLIAIIVIYLVSVFAYFWQQRDKLSA
ncbi:MAG: hypothetical protein LUF85_12895 [Bacteroides sp.]|nr:hypothetical protein [Bacteroides sp.]